MNYDTSYRFAQALAPDGLETLSAALHAVNAAVRDCERAGKPLARDPAIVLLIHNLARVADGIGLDHAALRQGCADGLSAVAGNPALIALAGHHLGHDPDAKRTFHVQARRALSRVGDALGLPETACRIRTDMGSDASSGDTSLEHAELFVTVAPWSVVAGREISIQARCDRRDVGISHRLPLAALLHPTRLAARIGAVLDPEGERQRRAA